MVNGTASVLDDSQCMTRNESGNVNPRVYKIKDQRSYRQFTNNDSENDASVAGKGNTCRKGYRILHTNICSLLSKLPEVCILIDKYNLDIISVNETHLDDTINDFELNIQGFTMYWNDRNRCGGGVALYIRDNVKQKLRPDLFIPGIESLWVEIFIPNSGPYLIGTMYRPPSARKEYYENMIENIELAASNNKEIILLGDLNFDYKLDESLSSNPVYWIEALFELTQLIEKPTRRTLTTSSLLDVILTSRPEKHISSGVIQTTFSDHYCVITVLDVSKPGAQKQQHNHIKFRDYKKFDKSAFLNDVKHSECFANVMMESDVIKGWGNWKEEFLKICDHHAPMVEKRLRNRNSPWITPQIIKMMYQRDYMHRKAVDTQCDDMWQKYRELRNKINDTIKFEKQQYYEDAIISNQRNPKSMWKKINELVRENKHNSTMKCNIPASKFNDFFSTIGHKVTAKLGNGCEFKWKNPPSVHSFEFHIIEENKVRKDIEALDSDSSNDVLKLDCKLLKLSSSLICTSLTHLFNLSLMSRIIPPDWKLARITPIYKGKGDTSEECNYRPISVLSYVAKLFEKQVHFQLLHYLEFHSFITPYQSAYLKKHSTVTCLHRVVDDMCENIDDDLLCGVCFLDIEKCFDSINHDILRRKLAQYGVNGDALQWFENYLQGRPQCVRVNNVTSESRPCTMGVPQGSILGPLLFLLYVNDFPQHVQNENCNIFADDTIIYSFGSNVHEVMTHLQGALDSAIPWYTSNRLGINADKSAMMLVGKNSKVQNHVNVTINNVPVEQVNSMKYLGIHLDDNLSWDVQCDKLYRNIAGKISVLRRIRSFTKPGTLKSLYEKTVQPVFDYACTVWSNTKQGNIQKLQRAQNYAARIVSGNFDYVNFRSLDLLHALKWPTVQERCNYFTALLMYKSINGLTPLHLTDSLVRACDVHDRNTRLSNSKDVHVPPHKSNILKRSFIYNDSVIWNNLPSEIKRAENLNQFTYRYKTTILNP